LKRARFEDLAVGVSMFEDEKPNEMVEIQGSNGASVLYGPPRHFETQVFPLPNTGGLYLNDEIPQQVEPPRLAHVVPNAPNPAD
jgi:hypothetical protein